MPDIQPGDIIEGFSLILPASAETCRAQVDSCLARRLPEALKRRTLTVIANGPSARGLDLKALTGPTLALNGAIRLFTAQGVAPTYWAALDPQALVADLLPDDPPEETIYLVASKCHPAVFDKLKKRAVYIWHLKDAPAAEGRVRVTMGPSITLSAHWLMVRVGFNDFDYHGWDGCFMDGIHHAAGNADWSARDDRVTINYGGTEQPDGTMLGGKDFATTRSWAAEAQAAGTLFAVSKYLGIGIRIHGDGMMAAELAAGEQ